MTRPTDGCTVTAVDVGALKLPHKGDAVDWLDQNPGATADDVLALPTVTAHTGGGEAGDLAPPVPLPTDLPPVAPFPPDLLPDALRPWVEDIAERMQCPPDFPAVGAMVCLSAVVGRQIAIRPKRRDDWEVIVNLWGAVVGRPSLLKSPALAEPMRFLQRLETAARDEHDDAMRGHQADELVAKLATKNAHNEISKLLKGKKEEEANGLARALVDATPQDEPRRRRYYTNDGTVEKIGELLRDNPRGLLVFRDELTGWLNSLDREGREGTRAFFLEAWNGAGRFTYDRIGRGTVEIDATCLSVLGGIQPGPLSGYLSGALAGDAGDDGLLQRLQLLAWPDEPRDWRNVDRLPDTSAQEAAWAVFERLDAMEPAALGAQGDEDNTVPWLRFKPDAQDEFDSWRQHHEERLRKELPPSLDSHLAKYRSLVPSLALLCHLADHPQGGPVSRTAVLRAVAWAEYLETHARRLYAQALAPDVVAAIELDRHLPDLPDPFKARDVYRRHWRHLDREGTQAALEVLEDYGRVTAECTTGVGRPTKNYRVHPSLRN